MASLRAMILANARLSLVLLTLAWAAKALIPAGFMISTGSERFLTVTICADASGATKQMQIAIPGRTSEDSAPGDAAGKAQPCVFASLGHSALGGADPVLLAAALAFILLVGLAPLAAPPARNPAFLRPPLRGPPSLSH